MEREEAQSSPGGDWVRGFLDHLRSHPDYQGELVHIEKLEARAPVFADPHSILPAALIQALARLEIPRLYSHQIEVYSQVRAGHDVVIVTGTASGKTLAYNLPIAAALLDDPEATALYLFPTKALAQDQLQAIQRLAAASPELGALIRAGTYDGDTSPHARRKLRDSANLILTNPDMLHQGILPYHPRWSRFFSRLAVVVVDEIHTYRGIFGSHVANVLRRLIRITDHHGARPRFISSSATIGNAGELASRLLNRPAVPVAGDGSPRGRRTVAFWNPAPLDPAGITRRSANLDASKLVAELMTRGVPTIAFTRSRVGAELVFRYARDELRRRGDRIAERLSPYRSGYLPAERREIEARLFSGELLGVISTNALELGIDVGGLDAAVLVGFPSTIASSWQQIGRAGRGRRDSLAVVIAHEDPIDQYLMRNPRFFFGRSPENAVIDPENPYVVAAHLGCAAHELPLTGPDLCQFGSLGHAVAEILADEGRLTVIEGNHFWSSPELPARKVSLRTLSDDTYSIIEAADGGRMVGTVDAVSGLELVYPEAVYLHEGESYVVRELDLAGKIARVERTDVDYYTQPVLDMAIRVRGEETRRALGAGAGERARERSDLAAGGSDAENGAASCDPATITGSPLPAIGFGPVEVSWQTVAMKKIRFRTRESIGYHPLELPRLTLETRSLWLWIGEEIMTAVTARDRSPYAALGGLRNLLVTLVPVYSMCDPTDLGGVIDTRNLGRPCIFLFDRYPGGLGFAEQAYMHLEELIMAAADLAGDCPCHDGCPSCVGLPLLRPAQQQDLDLHHGHPIPSKSATLALVSELRKALRAAAAGCGAATPGCAAPISGCVPPIPG